MLAALQQTLRNVTDNVPLSAPKRRHLSLVYRQLLCGLAALLATVVGTLHLSGSSSVAAAIVVAAATALSLPLLLVASCYIACVRRGAKWRASAFYTVAICLGILIAQTTAAVTPLYPKLITEALAITCIVFGGFTGAALLADKSTLIGVYAAINSVALYMTFVFISSFFTYRFVMSPLTMIASVLFESLYLYMNTMEIVLRPSSMDKDPLDDAFILLTNLVSLFLTIVRELIRKEERSRNDRRRR